MNFQSAQQNSGSPLLAAAENAARVRDFRRSIEFLHRAGNESPTSFNIHILLGYMYGKCYDYALAERSFDMAAHVAEFKSHALTLAGKRCMQFGNFGMAEKFFKRAIEQKDASANELISLAELYERRDCPGEAAVLVERVLQSEADHPAALLVRARLNRRAGEWAAAEKDLRAILGKSENKMQFRAHAWCELGGVLDFQGNYDEAMAAFLQAKTLLRPAATGLARQQTLRSQAEEMEANISSEMMRRWAGMIEELKPKRRLAVLAGHVYHSGYELLEGILDAHPQALYIEESHVFVDEVILPARRRFSGNMSTSAFLDSLPVNVLREMREDYFYRTMEVFRGQKSGDLLVVEKNHILNLFIPAMARVFPDAKIIMGIRDPRDVCLSCFMQFLPPNACSAHYLTMDGTVAEYIKTMGFWSAIQSRMGNPCLEVRHEDWVNNLEATAQRTLKFLEIDWSADALRHAGPAQKKSHSGSFYADINKPIFTGVGHWRNYQKHLEPYLEKLDPFIKTFGYE